MSLTQSLVTLVEIFSKAKTRSQITWLFEDLLTPAEIQDIADRITVLKKLKEWKSQRKIADEMWISVTTVSRGSKLLKFSQKEINKFL